MIIVSDMMGTLTTGSPFLGLVDWVKHNQSKLRANFYLAAITPSYILAKNGLIDWQRWGQKLMVDSLAYIKDADEEKLRHASEWVVEHNLWAKRREDVVARLVQHREAGGQVSFVPHLIDDDSGVGTQVATAELNGDKRPDVIVGNKKGIFVHLSQGGAPGGSSHK